MQQMPVAVKSYQFTPAEIGDLFGLPQECFPESTHTSSVVELNFFVAGGKIFRKMDVLRILY